MEAPLFMHQMAASPQKRKESKVAVVLSSRVVPKTSLHYLAAVVKHGCGGGAPVCRRCAPATTFRVPARAPRDAAPDDEPVAAGGEHYPAPALQLRRRRHQGRGEQGT